MTCAIGCSKIQTKWITVRVREGEKCGAYFIQTTGKKKRNEKNTCKMDFKNMNEKKRKKKLENRIKNPFNEYICQFKLEIENWFLSYKPKTKNKRRKRNTIQENNFDLDKNFKLKFLTKIVTLTYFKSEFNSHRNIVQLITYKILRNMSQQLVFWNKVSFQASFSAGNITFLPAQLYLKALYSDIQ